MHFVDKTDNLFRSIRVSYGNSSVTKGFHFFLTYLKSIVFLCSKCTIQSHIINFQPFLTSFVIFHAFTDLFRVLNDGEIENLYKMNSENVGTWHGIIFRPHSMCKRVERVTAKTGRTSRTNWTISFGVSRLRTRTHLLVRKD